MKSVSLEDPKKIFLPPLHIKLGLIKNMVNALSKNDDWYKHLETKFSRISEAKLKPANQGIDEGHTFGGETGRCRS